MNAKYWRDDGQVRSMPTLLLWGGLFAAGLGFMVVIGDFRAETLGKEILLGQLFSYQLASYANLLLIGAAVLYIVHLRITALAVGRAASGFAAAGALCLLSGIMMRWLEANYLHRPGYTADTGLYEVMAVFSAVTVLIYLVMERVYRTRSAGAFVMPVVVSAVLFEIWLVSNEQAAPDQVLVFKSYWVHAHVLANFIGYGAFAVAASMGILYLLRYRAQLLGQNEGFAIRALPDLPAIDRLMHHAIQFGFPIFSFATIMGIGSAYHAWGSQVAWDPRETWALIVWLIYATYFHLRYAHRWGGQRMAWWAIIGFGVTLSCFFAVNLLFYGFHLYGHAPA
jgi:cytochrome c-type biogenesis protein CcsB